MLFSSFVAQFWRGPDICNPLNPCVFKRLPKKYHGANMAIFFISKKMLFLPHPTIVYEPTFYTYQFPLLGVLCG